MSMLTYEPAALTEEVRGMTADGFCNVFLTLTSSAFNKLTSSLTSNC
ncbi:MAG: hypothetical protein NC431_05105 [Firmicutes bacterium]|nr:hypothetical protein [Bacillota bacterium]